MGKLPPALAKYQASKKSGKSTGKAKPATKPAFLTKKSGKK